MQAYQHMEQENWVIPSTSLIWIKKLNTEEFKQNFMVLTQSSSLFTFQDFLFYVHKPFDKMIKQHNENEIKKLNSQFDLLPDIKSHQTGIITKVSINETSNAN